MPESRARNRQRSQKTVNLTTIKRHPGRRRPGCIGYPAATSSEAATGEYVGSIQFDEWHDDRDSTRRIGLCRRHARQGWECGGHPLPNAEIDDEQVPSSPPSFRLDVGSPDHLAPLLGFVGDELAEV